MFSSPCANAVSRFSGADMPVLVESCPKPTGAVLRRGQSSCGCAHRRLLGSVAADVVERLEAVRTGRPSVNTAVVWRYYTEKVYQNADLPLVAVRECLQNAVDAIDQAVKARQIKRGEGFFGVTWAPEARILRIADNGIGMDMDTFFGKFMVIGESGKKNAEVTASEGGRGGFGVAKAVILGTSSTFKWSIHSRDHVFVSQGFDGDVEAFKAHAPRQGTLIELFDVAERFAVFYDRRTSAWLGLAERARHMLALNDLDVKITFNNAPVERYFDRRKGAKVVLELDWGPATTASVKLYRRQDRSGRYYVRLNGLYQFDKAPSRSLPGDVVIDLDTDVRPDDPRRLPYPLTAARDGLTEAAAAAAEQLMAYLEVENVSAGKERDYDDLQAMEPTVEEATAAEEVVAATQAAFEDPDILGALRSGVRGVEDYYREQANEQARIGPGDPDELSKRPSGLAPKAVGQASPEQPQSQGVAALVAQVLDVLSAADHQRQRLGSSKGSVLSEKVQTALQSAAVTGELAPRDIGPVRAALDVAGGAALGLHGGGLLQLAGVELAYQALKVLAPAATRASMPHRNPFGTAGAVLISRKRYSRPKARRFLANYKKWLPYLIVWDATCRMVASELNIPKLFVAGFVLDDDVVALARAANGRIAVYINPDQFEVVRKASIGHPLTLAMFLLHTAVHELTHVDGRMGQGHDEEFIAAREDNGQKVAPLMVAVAALAQRILRLPESSDQKAMRKLRERLARVREELQAARGQLRKAGARPDPAQKRERAADLVDLLEGQLLGTPPDGVDPGYVAGFFSRNRGELIKMVRELLADAERVRASGTKRQTGVDEVVEHSRKPAARRLPWDPHRALGTVYYLPRGGDPRVTIIDPGTDYDGLPYALTMPRPLEVPVGTVRRVRYHPEQDFGAVVEKGQSKAPSEIDADAVVEDNPRANSSYRLHRLLTGPHAGETLFERDRDRAVPNTELAEGERVLVLLRPLDDVAEFLQVLPPDTPAETVRRLLIGDVHEQ